MSLSHVVRTNVDLTSRLFSWCRSISTLIPRSLSSSDHLDLSRKKNATITLPDGHPMQLTYLKYLRDTTPFPDNTTGFLYLNQPRTVPGTYVSQLRFRLTSNCDPSSFHTGRDLELPDEIFPWSLSWYKIADPRPLCVRTLRKYLIKEGITSIDEMAACWDYVRQRQDHSLSFMVHTLDDPFCIKVGRQVNFIPIATPDGPRMVRINDAYGDFRKYRAGNDVREFPYRCYLFAKFALSKEHAHINTRTIVARILDVRLTPMDVPRQDGYTQRFLNYDGHTPPPLAGELVRAGLLNGIWHRNVDGPSSGAGQLKCLADNLKPECDDKTRWVFNEWPKHPKGSWPNKQPAPDGGKTAGNGYLLWGATLYDFYRHLPTPHYNLFSTGSRLAAWARHTSKGDLVWAEDSIAWADREPDPVVVPPPNVLKAVMRCEAGIRAGSIGRSMSKPVLDNMQYVLKNFPARCKLKDFPSPWPLLPFSYDAPNIRAQLSDIPTTLVVHDPWDVLTITEKDRDYYGNWTRKGDSVRLYKLQKFPSVVPWRNALPPRAPDRDAYLIIREPDSRGYAPPALRIVHTTPPMTSDTVAHLYISPTEKLGSGHHSFVYKAELELSREKLTKPEICLKCARKLVDEEFARQKAAGELTPIARSWLSFDEDMAPPTSFEEALRGKLNGRKKARARKSPESLQAVARLTGGKMVHTHVKGVIGEFRDTREKYLGRFYYGDSTWVERPAFSTDRWVGPMYDAPIPPEQVPWRNPYVGPFCEHVPQLDAQPTPPLARVAVAAKLSIEGDGHLSNEARNYQSFPAHFFEDWSGYNILQPLHDPVPLAPLVPQYYGYYVPDSASKYVYRSPILLLENCGKAIDIPSLGIDDRQECASLFYRLFNEGWLHESTFARNILMLPEDDVEEDNFDVRFKGVGRVSAVPHLGKLEHLGRKEERQHMVPKHERRFRLCDFGRSKYIGFDFGEENERFVARSCERMMVEKELKLGAFGRQGQPY
ncbi:hypothetical protein FISHEDRAFT_73201 [Fistulina hepatica ATCC 64428]|uniref:Protein kinase domain-containing protein n=1 Tax=Fistulina hepatica ATCC 64428 TaxID=1128425 RepID=A0A0D7ADW5_9AGAR|nr:hypothetical protein FISHEDRAFT_73201 [Fistulina hepatica ATCC 64428]